MALVRNLFSFRSERGSLALEQVLFIGAIVAMSAGLIAFYDDLASYFTNFSVASPPTDVGSFSRGGAASE